jgi:hypothetical protein
MPPPELRSDKEVVWTAISNSGFALAYASPELRSDKGIVMDAVSKSPVPYQVSSALKFAS